MYAEALSRVMGEITDRGLPATDPFTLLDYITQCALIYPMLLMKSQETVTISKLTGISQHRCLRLDTQICKRLLQRMLLAVIEKLFARAEDIRTSVMHTERIHLADTAVIEVRNPSDRIIQKCVRECCS